MPNGLPGPQQVLEPLVSLENAVISALAAPLAAVGVSVPPLQGPLSVLRSTVGGLNIPGMRNGAPAPNRGRVNEGAGPAVTHI